MDLSKLKDDLAELDYLVLSDLRDISMMDDQSAAIYGCRNWADYSKKRLANWAAKREKMIQAYEEQA